MSPSRRELFGALSVLGIGSLPFQRALAATADETPKAVSVEMVKNAEWVAGIALSEEDRLLVAAALSRAQAGLSAARKEELPNALAPAMHFIPNPWQAPYFGPRGTVTPPTVEVTKPEKDADLAFLPMHQLAHLVKSKKISSVELTKFFLARLQKHNETLKFMVTPTEDLALKQAKQADEEIAAGKYRGVLHGIPYGAKDLINVPGYKTTWGSEHYKNQSFDTMATVAEKLAEAGAVLVAKLTLGALAYGDQWFGGMTRNPWDTKQGSSGSSAGSASAVAAGCVPFAIGSETHGSILSPSARCGVTGLRPTFGRVSRAGCMALAWTMDKVGPLARCVDDCALVLGVIHGADPLDPCAQDRPFDWPGTKKLSDTRVGYFEKGTREATLESLRKLGVKLVPMTLPSMANYRALSSIVTTEASSAFEVLARTDVKEGLGLWGTSFKQGQFYTAVDYLRAQRLRSRLMQEMAKAVENVDCYVGGNDLLLTNLTGHPSIGIPNGFTKTMTSEVPMSITFTGKLFGETELLTLVKAYQDVGGHHLKRPPLRD